jgi:hypothetical protein
MHNDLNVIVSLCTVPLHLHASALALLSGGLGYSGKQATADTLNGSK